MKIFLIVLSLFLLNACALTGTYQVGVKSSVQVGAATAEKTFVIRPMDPQIDRERNTEYLNYAKQVSAMLTEKGFVLVDDPNQAFQVVFIYYFSSIKSLTYSDKEPVYGPGGTRTVRRGNTIYNEPISRVVGYKDVQRIKVNRESGMSMIANKIIHQGKEYETGSELWKTQVASSGEDSSNLSDVLPAMLSAARNYIGENTSKQVEIRVDKADPTRIWVMR